TLYPSGAAREVEAVDVALDGAAVEHLERVNVNLPRDAMARGPRGASLGAARASGAVVAVHVQLSETNAVSDVLLSTSRPRSPSSGQHLTTRQDSRCAGRRSSRNRQSPDRPPAPTHHRPCPTGGQSARSALFDPAWCLTD